MSLTHRTIKAGLWAVVQNGGRQVISTIIFLALARLFLSKEEFGLFALANTLIVFLNVFVSQGLSTAIIQRGTLRVDHLNSAFWANVFVGVTLTLMVVLYADLIALAMGDERITPILQVLSANLIFASLSSIHESLLSRDLRYRSLALRTLIASIISGAVGISCAYAGSGVWTLVAMQLIVSLSGMIVLWWSSPWRPQLKFSAHAYREILPMSVAATGLAIVSILHEYSDQFIVGKLLGAGALGIYVVSQKVVKLLFTLFFQSIISVVFPSFSRLEGNANRARSAMLRAMSVSSIVSFPVFLGLAVTADLIVPMVFGSKWIEAVPVMSILCIWGALGSITYYFGPVLLALGYIQTVLRYVALGAVLLMALCVSGAQFGLVGISGAVVIAPIVTLPLWVSALNKYLGVTYAMLANAFWRNFLAAILMVLLILSLRQLLGNVTLRVELVLTVSVGMVAYPILLWLVANANARAAITMLRQVVQK